MIFWSAMLFKRTYSSIEMTVGISDHSLAYLTGVTVSWGSRSTCMCIIRRQKEALNSNGRVSSDIHLHKSSNAQIITIINYPILGHQRLMHKLSTDDAPKLSHRKSVDLHREAANEGWTNSKRLIFSCWCKKPSRMNRCKNRDLTLCTATEKLMNKWRNNSRN